MKKQLYSLLLLSMAACCIAGSCKKNKHQNPVDQLPPETQTGANTFGCLVDGKVFKPAGSSLSGPNLAATYQYIEFAQPYGYVFAISGVNKKDPCNINRVGFAFDSIEMKPGIYSLLQRKNGQGGGQYLISKCYEPYNQYLTSQQIQGVVTITKFDLTTQIASGTFWFNAVNDKGNTVKVTDGRFDVRFTR